MCMKDAGCELQTTVKPVAFGKSLGPQNFSQFLATTIMWQSVISQEKMVNLYVNNS